MTARPAGWRKSSWSAQETDCVEVGRTGGAAAVRDSKNPSGGHLEIPEEQWRSFIAGIKAGRFDN
ncbi:DUF397 domain-containing protein [Saccharopolyspora rectivirgula]|jgi:hypothetical protein|uniref:DUF397 domain-containing protein n=1 Tax=Saccharopolyspora rectivirgula TaxID=28042 RepID=UPI0009DF2744|nr:DUF397 domain-containing protein [Saccharopolyspora rectivirgula]MCC5697174.1 DUF397 domain-containing protein [Klebsiella pneumoniae]